jgi:hypothetical protein
MKKTFYFGFAMLLSISLMASACSSDDDGDSSSNSNTQQIIAIENTVESGNWRVTYFFDTDSDETSDFNGYAFTFSDNGTLTATNGTNTYTGSWSVTDSSSSSDDDSSDDDIDFNISFSSPPDFAELTDDWDIIEYSDTRIALIDISGGNGGTDYLTFEKN